MSLSSVFANKEQSTAETSVDTLLKRTGSRKSVVKSSHDEEEDMQRVESVFCACSRISLMPYPT